MSGPGRRARGLVSLAWRGLQIFVAGVQSTHGGRYPDSLNGRHANPGRSGRNPCQQRPSERFARLNRPPLRCVTANPERSLRGAEGRTAARRAGNGCLAAPPRRRALTLTNPAPPHPPHTPPTATPPAETDAAPPPPHSPSRPNPAHQTAASIHSQYEANSPPLPSATAHPPAYLPESGNSASTARSATPPRSFLRDWRGCFPRGGGCSRARQWPPTPLGLENGRPKEARMTITLRPEQERVIQQAIETGMYNSVDEVLDFALDFIRKREAFHANATRSQIAGQRIRELRKGVTLGGISIKELIEEGRE